MEHKLFKPKTLDEGKNAVVGDCNGIPMETRYKEETPVFAKKILELTGGKYRILDYGCGIGRLAKEILRQTLEPSMLVIGVDNSHEMLEQAAQNVSNSRFVALLPEELDTYKQGFNTAVLAYVLQHAPAIAIRGILRRIHHYLKDNGCLLYCSSDYRMAIRFDNGGFFDDRFLGVDLREELSRYFDLVGPAFTDEELERNKAVKCMVKGINYNTGGQGLAHPALVYKKRKPGGAAPKVERSPEEARADASQERKDTGTVEIQAGGESLQKVKNPRRLILVQKQSPGDVMMATVALRDLHQTYPGEYITDMRSPCNEIFLNNPYVTPIDIKDKNREHQVIEELKGDDKHPPITHEDVLFVNLHYPMIHQSGMLGTHFADAMTEFLSQQLKRPIKRHGLHPELYMDQSEALWPSPVTRETGYEGKYWVLNAGSKSDYPLKQYPYYQEVVDLLKDKVQFVQVGVKSGGHHHKPLSGVVDMIGKTTLRDLMRAIYHAEGILTCVSVHTHIAAAFRKPCVVIAGGREGSRWEYYSDQRFLCVNGALDCCHLDGCWKSTADQCLHINNGVPLCMDLIRPEDVANAVEMYYKGRVLKKEKAVVKW